MPKNETTTKSKASTKNEADAPISEFAKLLDDDQYAKIPKAGELVHGKVVSVSSNEVRLDIDGFTTGVVRARELFPESSEYDDLKVGSEVEATVIDLENENGEMELSFRFAGHQKVWAQLLELKESGKVVEAVVTDANKGGVMVKVEQVGGFLPVSQLTPEHYPRVPGGDKHKILERLRDYAGQSFRVKIIDADEREDKLIVSEKAAWEDEQREVIAKYKVAEKVKGTITAVTDFGVFVEFGDNLEGLIHISELAWKRIDNPSEIHKVGDTIEAEIIKIEGSKIFLSTKKLMRDPWAGVGDRYKVGQIVKCTILKVNPFGLFVELDPEIHGLAHISQLSSTPIKDINELAKPGDVLEFKIISLEPEKHRLGLSRKDLTPGAPKEEKSKKETKEVKENKEDKVDDKKEHEKGKK